MAGRSVHQLAERSATAQDQELATTASECQYRCSYGIPGVFKPLKASAILPKKPLKNTNDRGQKPPALKKQVPSQLHTHANSEMGVLGAAQFQHSVPNPTDCTNTQGAQDRDDATRRHVCLLIYPTCFRARDRAAAMHRVERTRHVVPRSVSAPTQSSDAQLRLLVRSQVSTYSLKRCESGQC